MQLKTAIIVASSTTIGALVYSYFVVLPVPVYVLFSPGYLMLTIAYIYERLYG